MVRIRAKVTNENDLVLNGESARDFLEYDSRELSEEEKESLRKALEYYESKVKNKK